MLDYVEDNPILINVVKDATKDYNYYKEIQAAECEYDKGYYIKMPQADKAKVALIVGLLHELREGIKGITNFVSKYYKDKNIAGAHKKFFEQAILPFRDAFIRMLTQGVDSAGEQLMQSIPHIECFPNSAKEELRIWTEELIQTIAIDKMLPAQDKQDYGSMLAGLGYVLKLDDTVLLDLFWTATKRVLKGYKKGKAHLAELEAIIKKYKII